MVHEHDETIPGQESKPSCTYDFEMSLLGKRLMEIRKKFITEGGKLLTREELEREMADRRSPV